LRGCLKINRDDVEVMSDGSMFHRLVTKTGNAHLPTAALQRVCKKVKSCTCYSATYTSQSCHQNHFTVPEVAANWHELMIPQRTVRLSTAHISEQFATSRHTTAPPPQSATLDLHHRARKLLLISHPAQGRRLS